jgi:hypothetical protein
MSALRSGASDLESALLPEAWMRHVRSKAARIPASRSSNPSPWDLHCSFEHGTGRAEEHDTVDLGGLMSSALVFFVGGRRC